MYKTKLRDGRFYEKIKEKFKNYIYSRLLSTRTAVTKRFINIKAL